VVRLRHATFACAVACSSIACDRAAPPAPPAAPAAQPSAGAIDRARLLRVDEEPGQWLTTGRDFGKTHYSPLDRINADTVGRLGFAWEYHTNTKRGLEATPIVVDGILYTSGPAGRVYALDARTGAELWTFDPQVDGQAYRKACCDAVNRGVAVWRGKVYVAALDGRLFALDAATGAVLWQAETFIDPVRGYASTGAPEVAGKVVVIGNGGGELDARGYISAYDLETGEFAWRFFTVPGDPKQGFEHPELEMAAATWDPASRWEVGLGGTVWDALVYDPELNLLYVGTGNAALYNQAERSPAGGDNLFLTSILAINPDTGRLVWYYQEVPGDSWDYTATQPILLADLKIDGRLRKVLMQAPKNGFFYVLDRETGEFLSATPFAYQNWASAIDPETGRATVNKAAVDYSRGVKLVFPSVAGAHGWHPMAYSPRTGLAYIPVMEAGNYLFDPTEGHEYRPGLWNQGTEFVSPGTPDLDALKLPAEVAAAIRSGRMLEGQPPATRGLLRAWDPIARRVAWEIETAGDFDRSGVLATAGDLVIHGTVTGMLRALDARSGAILKQIDVGTSIVAAPASYEIDGEQYVAVMAGLGGGLYTQNPAPESAAYIYGNQGRILAFKLDGGPTPKPAPLEPIAPIPEPPPLTASPEAITHGGKLFRGTCGYCHLNSPRGYPPDLRRMSQATHAAFDDIVLKGLLRGAGMPQWDDLMSAADVEAIHAYLISLAWDAYEAEQVDLSRQERAR
jgi:quinohemoprotein ethanol dehydrogenase